VLAPGGRVCAAFVHPINSLSDLDPEVSYFDVVRYEDVIERDGAVMTFNDVHRPLSGYMRLFEDAGLVVEALREPVPDDEHVAAFPAVKRWRSTPMFLQVRALRPI
jgi:hypothetical protein